MNYLDIMYFTIVISLMAGYMMWRENEHIKERRDLLNRIMAKDLGDLKNHLEGSRDLGSRNSVRAGLKRSMGEQGQERIDINE